MKIYFAPNTRAVRIVWLFEELGLPYELELFKLGDASMRSPSSAGSRANSRRRQGHDLRVGSNRTIRVSEVRQPPAYPRRRFPGVSDLLQWFHYAEGMIMPPINTIVVETVLLSPERRNQVNVDRATKLLSRMLASVDAGVRGKEFLAGQFSAADIMLGQACMAAKVGANFSGLPDLSAYLDRLRERPAFKKANASGKPNGGDVSAQP
jgi:glutathione S-transferase